MFCTSDQSFPPSESSGREVLVVPSDKGCQFIFLVRLGRGDHAAVFGVVASGAAPCFGA